MAPASASPLGPCGQMRRRRRRLEWRYPRLEGRYPRLEGRYPRLEGRYPRLEGRYPRLEGRYPRLEERYSRQHVVDAVADHGARGDGSDATAALSAAIAEGVATGRAVHIPGGDYLCLGSICNISATDAQDARLPVIYGDGIGVTVLTSYLAGPESDVRALFDIAGSHSSAWLQAPGLGKAGSRELTLPSTSGLRRGQTLYAIDRGQPFLSNSRRTVAGYAGEIVRICEVLGPTRVLTYGGLEFTYGPDAHYRVPAHRQGFTLRELTIRNPAPGTQSGAARAVKLRLARDVRIENVRFESLDASAIRFSHVLDFRVQGCEFSDLENVRTNNNPYGICCTEWCSSGVVSGCVSNFGCHLFTAGCNPVASPPSHIVVANCVASNHTKAAFDTHPGSRFITFIGDQVHGCTGPGFQIRGPDCQVIEPVVSGLAPAPGDSKGRSGVGVYFVQGADRGRLRGGRIANVPYGVIVRGSSDVSIVGTRLQNVLSRGIYIQADNAYPTPTHLRIDDIDIIGSPSATGIECEVWDPSFSISRVRCRELAAAGQGPTTVAGQGEATAASPRQTEAAAQSQPTAISPRSPDGGRCPGRGDGHFPPLRQTVAAAQSQPTATSPPRQTEAESPGQTPVEEASVSGVMQSI